MSRGDQEIFEHIDFQRKAGEKYREILASFESARNEGMTIHVLDGTLPAEELANKVLHLIMPIIKG